MTACWASACLLHVPREELAGILGRIHRALKPGGAVLCELQDRPR